MRRQVADFLAYDWEGPPRRFVATERAFGFDVPLPLRVGKRTLHVRGSIDRLDVEGKTTIVRDLKTGRAHPRRGNEADPTPDQDLQLGLYGLVVAAQAKAWGVPARVAVAYVYPGGGGATERAFRDDHAVLDAAATEWLTLAADLLEARAFPRTIDPDDCTYCSFDAACGPDAHARAGDVLGPAKGVLARFRALKESP